MGGRRVNRLAALDRASKPKNKKVSRELRPKKPFGERFASMAALQILFAESDKALYGTRADILREGKGTGTARDGMVYRHRDGEVPQNIVELAAGSPMAMAALNHPLWKVLGNAGTAREVVLWVLANDFPQDIYVALCDGVKPTASQLDPVGWHPYTLLQALLRIRRRNDLYALALAICMAHLSHRRDGPRERYDAARYVILRSMNALYFAPSTKAFAQNVSLYIDIFYFPEVQVASLRGHVVSLHGAQLARDAALKKAIPDFRPQDYWTDAKKWFPWRVSGRHVDDMGELEDLLTKDAFAVEMLLAKAKSQHTSPSVIPIQSSDTPAKSAPGLPAQPRKRRSKPKP